MWTVILCATSAGVRTVIRARRARNVKSGQMTSGWCTLPEGVFQKRKSSESSSLSEISSRSSSSGKKMAACEEEALPGQTTGTPGTGQMSSFKPVPSTVTVQTAGPGSVLEQKPAYSQKPSQPSLTGQGFFFTGSHLLSTWGRSWRNFWEWRTLRRLSLLETPSGSVHHPLVICPLFTFRARLARIRVLTPALCCTKYDRPHLRLERNQTHFFPFPRYVLLNHFHY